jgi:hypothetical protein
MGSLRAAQTPAPTDFLLLSLRLRFLITIEPSSVVRQVSGLTYTAKYAICPRADLDPARVAGFLAFVRCPWRPSLSRREAPRLRSCQAEQDLVETERQAPRRRDEPRRPAPLNVEQNQAWNCELARTWIDDDSSSVVGLSEFDLVMSCLEYPYKQ